MSHYQVGLCALSIISHIIYKGKSYKFWNDPKFINSIKLFSLIFCMGWNINQFQPIVVIGFITAFPDPLTITTILTVIGAMLDAYFETKIPSDTHQPNGSNQLFGLSSAEGGRRLEEMLASHDPRMGPHFANSTFNFNYFDKCRIDKEPF